MFELNCSFKNYEWGVVGNNSLVALLLKNANSNFQIDTTKPYAELWMGTHPSGPSDVKDTEESLITLISKNPDVLGPNIINHFGANVKDIPFLFKILSVNEPLSIQAHPDKTLAAELHTTKPEFYPDANHKPELAIALTPFEALVGFRQLEEIKKNIKSIPEFRTVIGDVAEELLAANNENYEGPLKKCFRAVITAPNDVVIKQVEHLMERVKKFTDVCSRMNIDASILETITKKYPGDIGCFILFFLNRIRLEPGQAIYLGPNVPHCYLKGDCVECMATSDNVVRLGLTPKYKDVDTLCAMLNYKCESKRSRICHPVQDDKNTLTFKPDVPDFAVSKIEIEEDTTKTLINRESASILIIIFGQGQIEKSDQDPKKLAMGQIFFLPTESEITIKCEKHMLLFQAFVP